MTGAAGGRSPGAARARAAGAPRSAGGGAGAGGGGGGRAVAPGFINMLSWATESLIQDGRAQSDIRQGVTLEVMGEGWSMGPLNEEMRRNLVNRQDDIKYPVTWTSLGDYLEFL